MVCGIEHENFTKIYVSSECGKRCGEILYKNIILVTRVEKEYSNDLKVNTYY